MAAHDLRAKILALVGQALHEGTEETVRVASAMALCRLIHQRGLPGDEREKARKRRICIDDLIDAMQEVHKVREQRGEEVPVPEPPLQPTVAPPPVKPPRDPQARMIPIVDQPARCELCHQRIQRGRMAVWSCGLLYHPSCYDWTEV